METIALTFRSTRFVAILAVAATSGAMGSLAASFAGLSPSVDAGVAIPRSQVSTPSLPSQSELLPLDYSAWDALPASAPVNVDPSSFGEHDFPRIAPAFKDGRRVGFRIFEIRASSPFARLGLQNDDVVRRINGFEMTSPERALEVYGKLKDAKQFRVDAERGDKPLRLDYVLALARAFDCPADSTSTIVLSRGEVDDMLAALEGPTTSCSIVPAFEGGTTIGFKVFGVGPGSFKARLCLQNGDVVTRINGYDVSSPERGLTVYRRLREASRVDVELRRKGVPMHVSYVIE